MTLYENPANRFVAGFIGSPAMNFFKSNGSKSGFSIGGKKIPSKAAEKADKIEVGIRPEHLKQCTKQKAIISGELEVVEQLGDHVLAHLITKSGIEFIAKFESLGKIKRGDTLHFDAAKTNIHLFDEKTGLHL